MKATKTTQDATNLPSFRISSTITSLINYAQKKLHLHQIPQPRLTAEIILSYLLGVERLELYKTPERSLSSRQIRSFNRLIQRFLAGVPLAYLVGWCEFMSLNFKVNRNVLIPRPETELLVEQTLRLLKLQVTPTENYCEVILLDIGTGCGNIAISLAYYYKLAPSNYELRIFASDISGQALRVARQNARAHKVDDLIIFSQGDLFSAFRKFNLKGKVNFIVSNPPYISQSAYKRLPKSVYQYEPRLALYAGKTGTELHERIIKEAPDWLGPKGYLIMEIGINQLEKLMSLFNKKKSFWQVDRIIRDYQNIPRVIVVHKKY